MVSARFLIQHPLIYHVPHRSHSPHSTGFLMASPNLPVLRKFPSIDTSSSDFNDQLLKALYEEEYTQCLQNLEGDDLAWLVDYLDKVRSCELAPLNLHSSQHRLSIVLNLPAPLLGSVCANSEGCAAPRGYSRDPTRFCLTFLISMINHSPPGVSPMCTTGPSTVPGFASNICGCILGSPRSGRRRWVIDAIAFRIRDQSWGS